MKVTVERAHGGGSFAPACPDLLGLGQVDPQLPPGGELLAVAEVVGHLRAGVARHQRGAVLRELAGCLHVGGTRRSTTGVLGCCAGSFPPTHTLEAEPWRLTTPPSARWDRLQRHMVGEAALLYDGTSRRAAANLVHAR